MGGALILRLRRQLSRPRSDDERGRGRGRPLDHLSLGAAIRPGDGEAPALVVASTPLVELARRRGLRQGARQVDVSVPCGAAPEVGRNRLSANCSSGSASIMEIGPSRTGSEAVLRRTNSHESVPKITCLSGVPYRHSAVRTGPQIRRDNPRVIGWREYVRARGFSRSGCLPHRIPRWTGTHQPVFSILRHAGHIRFEWPAGGVNFWRQRRHRFLGARRSSLSKNRSCLLMLPRTVRLDGRERV